MKNVTRIAAILFLLFAGLSSTRASAVIFLCSDICTYWQACGRNCTHEHTGLLINCGNYGCCISNTSNC